MRSIRKPSGPPDASLEAVLAAPVDDVEGEAIAVRDLTILFTDVSRASELDAGVGARLAAELVREHFQILGGIVRRRAGLVVKTVGDALMAVFGTPVEGVDAAIDMHEAMRALGHRHGAHLALRIGVDRGATMALEVAEGRFDYFGSTVNVAARMRECAVPHEILITDAVFRSAGQSERLRGCFVIPGTQRIKGTDGEVKTYRVRPFAAGSVADARERREMVELIGIEPTTS